MQNELMDLVNTSTDLVIHAEIDDNIFVDTIAYEILLSGIQNNTCYL